MKNPITALRGLKRGSIAQGPRSRTPMQHVVIAIGRGKPGAEEQPTNADGGAGEDNPAEKILSLLEEWKADEPNLSDQIDDLKLDVEALSAGGSSEYKKHEAAERGTQPTDQQEGEV